MSEKALPVVKARILIALLAILLLLTGCGKTRTVACDSCGEPQKVEADSNMDDSWIVYCDECYAKIFGEDGLIS